MWRMSKLGYKSVPKLEELKKQWREQETELRKARKAQHLLGKRLLLDISASDEPLDDLESYALSEQQVTQIIKVLKHGSAEKLESLISLRCSLQREDVRLMFVKAEGSIQLLIGLFTCSFADVQLEAARCLHELSQSDNSSVSQSCLPATSYLLTYLSGNSPEFTEMCLYVLGNLIVEGEATRNQLLLQGIIPALALCTQSPQVSVLEAVGYTLSQLLASKEAPEKIIPIVLESALTEAIVRHIYFETEDRIGVAVEFAWSLHYIIASQVNNLLLISHGIVPKLVQILSDLSTLALRSAPPDLELLICPLVRCVANLLTEVDATGNKVQIHDGRLLVALFVFIEQYHNQHHFLLTECLWAISNLTVEDPVVASAMLHYNMVPVLMNFLLTSKDIAAMVLTILCSIADLGPLYCEQLRQKNILPCLMSTLGGADVQVTLRSLDAMIYLFRNCPDLAEDFLNNYGLSFLEPYKNNVLFHEQVQTIWNLCTMQVNEDSNKSTME
ncbi:transmembrane and coiled-coil domain-containing 6 isoform X1 [Pelobates cultripes]|uniref:Transmembrane and coiled-coil domain-containing 6 isoform X1 n=2 Tax=Pelobates cultripes TaxID=61616 RepID=A0AAD1RPI9_PELCU|nr:transmembrane and coiled-coil domain-containing 6 isoform X1 [Pelobates cultripes]